MGVAWRARPAQGFRGVRSAAAELSLSGPVRSGHQEPVRGRAAPAVRLCTAPVTATAAALHRAGLQTAGPGEALPGHRPAAPGFHTHALIKLCYQPVCPCPREGAHSPSRTLSHARPGHVSATASRWAVLPCQKSGKDTHGSAILAGTPTRTPYPLTRSRLGVQGSAVYLVLHHVALRSQRLRPVSKVP